MGGHAAGAGEPADTEGEQVRCARERRPLSSRCCSPVEKASALGKKCTALMSDSWPVKVCVHFSSGVLHTLAVASHAPETNILPPPGATEMLMTSPLCSAYCFSCEPEATSHSMQLMSPEEVMIFWSSTKRQHER